MSARPKARRVRSPDATRGKLLAAAFQEIYRQGFQAASLDAILREAGVTKGALYHHFPDKAALGYAVVDEVIRQPVLEVYLGPLRDPRTDPVTAIQRVLRRRADDFDTASIALGCPLNNLAQEMSPLDEEFRRHIADALNAWTEGFAGALARGQAAGVVRGGLDHRQAAAFLVAAVEGSFGMAKNAKSPALLRSNLDMLATLVDTWRAPAARQPKVSRG